MKVGWIGIGNMGVPMVKNLVKAGFNVTVYNRTIEKAFALQTEVGVSVAHSPAELVAGNDFIITMLADDAALTEVYTGTDGILSGQPTAGLLAIDMSTVSPETTRRLAGLCAEKGIGYMDAPVSGSVKPAEDAQLIIMTGGKQADFDKAQPLFNAMGKLSLLLGDNGAGNNAKLAINLFLAITIQGFSESILFAQQNGISTQQFLDIVNNGAAGSEITKLKSAAILADNFKAAFALKHLAKDLRLAEGQGMHLPAGKAVAASYKAANDNLGDEDMIAIIKHLQNK
ncbi:NAD(P)-dependent oxidoreductase [Mucilaginibacter boryungensis]|uniref:NAD(P)-dependent oxidoreductase n=1 Tax=Mucilaginibacter boryungensis TaxID=768480 RepID=A0ABR9XC42_9SPHI|nr:NAD(P)-dependent oxidoreductase [Mucilaginibacter boryungensis]